MDDQLRQARSRNERITVWTGVLLPAIVWGLQMQLNYTLVRVACSAQRNTTLYLVTIAALLISIGSGLYTLSRKPGRSTLSDPETSSNGTFLWALALLSSGIFSLVILAQSLAVIFFHPCQL